MNSTVLVTGGAGYIGSTVCLALERAGHVPVVLDSLVTGKRAFVRDRIFYEGDVADRVLVRRIVTEHPDIECTIHLAARISVTASVEEPYTYYRDNVSKSLELFDELAALGRRRIVLSSSASVYGATAALEVDEDFIVDPQSPYGRTKLMTELILRDLAAAGQVTSMILRYFNPIGADPTLQSGTHEINPTHVLGQLANVAAGKLGSFRLTGTDYPTRDGTGIRDYIHVWDLALAHVAAVERFDSVLDQRGERCVVLNLGSGRGVTVRELVAAVERVSGVTIPISVAAARRGDPAGAFANVDRAEDLLGWASTMTLDEGIESALAWNRKRRDVLGYE